MGRSIKIKPGKKNVVLPDGNIYQADDEVVLTDAQWAAVTPATVTDALIDQGVTSAPGEGLGDHDHDADYSPLGHTHTHNHDADYAADTHTHAGGVISQQRMLTSSNGKRTMGMPGVSLIYAGSVPYAPLTTYLHFQPFFCDVAMTLDAIGIYVSTAGSAGQGGRWGIYDSNDSLRAVGAPLYEGTISVATTGAKTLTPNLALDPGFYSCAFEVEGGSLSVYGGLAPFLGILEDLTISSFLDRIILSHTYGALPTDPAAPLLFTGNNNFRYHQLMRCTLAA